MNRKEEIWLAKMEPKKVLKKEYVIDGHKLVFESDCPTCESAVQFNDNYCKNCGQKLDWKKEKKRNRKIK